MDSTKNIDVIRVAHITSALQRGVSMDTRKHTRPYESMLYITARSSRMNGSLLAIFFPSRSKYSIKLMHNYLINSHSFCKIKLF